LQATFTKKPSSRIAVAFQKIYSNISNRTNKQIISDDPIAVYQIPIFYFLADGDSFRFLPGKVLPVELFQRQHKLDLVGTVKFESPTGKQKSVLSE